MKKLIVSALFLALVSCKEHKPVKDPNKLSSYIPSEKQFVSEFYDSTKEKIVTYSTENGIYAELYKNGKLYAIKAKDFCYIDNNADDFIDFNCYFK